MWVAGLVKSDYLTHSGFHQSSAWIQNPSSSQVWQYKIIQGVMVGRSPSIGGSPFNYNFFYYLTSRADLKNEDNLKNMMTSKIKRTSKMKIILKMRTT